MLIQKLLVFGIVCQCYYSQETVYKFWTGNMNQITCNKTKTDFMNYSQQFMKTECNVTFEDGNQIPRRTLCHAITLVSGLICDDLSVSVSNISKLLAQSITANKSCGDDGIRKYQHIELLQKDTNSAISENLKKILNNCTQSCSAMPNVCATFVKFCQIAFEATSAGRKVPLVNTTKAMKSNAVQIMTTTSQPKPQVAPLKAEENQPTRSNADASSQNNMPVNYYNPSDSGTFLGDHMYLILLATLSCIIFYILLLKKNRPKKQGNRVHARGQATATKEVHEGISVGI
ncbi:uncharacterized protein LOC142342723 isoform X2 [Convolutriloba macropyga]|uniref:uncharacterized protein LOC142342723 isoform X2 n=1 Tax=Convolutriloba macropyga TaxID=536237 RepID=UPI003F522AAF